MNIGGELILLLKDIEYSTKQELLEKLRIMRNDLKTYPKKERKQIRPLLTVAIQQAFYASEYDLLRVKRRVENGRRNNGRNKDIENLG